MSAGPLTARMRSKVPFAGPRALAAPIATAALAAPAPMNARAARRLNPPPASSLFVKLSWLRLSIGQIVCISITSLRRHTLCRLLHDLDAAAGTGGQFLRAIK